MAKHKTDPALLSADYYRFHKQHAHTLSTFGDDWFALKAEAFARFFGTPTFLIGQTMFVTIWIVLNAVGVVGFDVYPFILLNLAFSLQAAYAAPLILLAQTRQADRDKAQSLADAQHREDLDNDSEQRQKLTHDQTCLLVEMVKQNTELTEAVKSMTERIEQFSKDLHAHIVAKPASQPDKATGELPRIERS